MYEDNMYLCKNIKHIENEKSWTKYAKWMAWRNR